MKAILGHGNHNTVAVIEESDFDWKLAQQIDVDGYYVVDGTNARYVNRDGTESLYCGNAMRVLGLVYGKRIVRSVGTLFTVTGSSPVTVAADISVPEIEKIIHNNIEWFKMDIPNRHIVTFNNVNDATLELFSRELEVNASRAILKPEGVQVDTCETGAGFTRSCASAATAVALLLTEKSESEIRVFNRGGWIDVTIALGGYAMFLAQKGKAEITETIEIRSS